MSVQFDYMHRATPTQRVDSEPELVAVPLGALSKLQRTLYIIATAWGFAHAIARENGFCDEGAAARDAVRESFQL